MSTKLFLLVRPKRLKRLRQHDRLDEGWFVGGWRGKEKVEGGLDEDGGDGGKEERVQHTRLETVKDRS